MPKPAPRVSFVRRGLFGLALAGCLPSAVGAASAGTARGSMPATRDRTIAPEIARILDRGELRVAVLNRNLPPFMYSADDRMRGIDIDLVESVGAALGAPVRYDRSAPTHDDIVRLVASGQADLGVSKLARTLQRAQQVLFSDPYMRLEHAMLINRVAFARVAGDRPVKPVIRRYTGSIGVLGGSAWGEFARRHFPAAQIVEHSSWRQTVDAVKRGDIVMAYRDAVEIQQVMRSDSSLSLTLRTVQFTDIASLLSVMIGPGNVVLQSLVNEVLAARPSMLTTKMVVDALERETTR